MHGEVVPLSDECEIRLISIRSTELTVQLQVRLSVRLTHNIRPRQHGLAEIRAEPGLLASPSFVHMLYLSALMELSGVVRLSTDFPTKGRPDALH